MAMSTYETIWQILSTNNFKDQIPQEFHCIICKNITIEPYVSLCGCRFCTNCIREYLKDGSKYCPGDKQECVEDKLILDVNVLKDLVALRCIRRCIVTCPNENCEVRCDVESMTVHLRICCMSSTKCPYEIIGCQAGQMSKDNVKTHYDNEWLIHSQLLVEAIDNLKNEVEGLRNIVERKDEQITKFNKDFERNEVIILEMKQQIDEQRNDIDLLKDKNGRKENELEVIRKDLKDKEITIVEMKRQIDEQRTDHDILKDKDRKRKNELKEMREDFKMKETQRREMKEELDKVKNDIVDMDVRSEIRDQNQSLNNFKENQDSIVKEMAFLNVKVRDSQIYDEREFMWRVDNFSEMRDNSPKRRRVILWRYSFKFELYLWWFDGGGLYFKWKILKGDFDDGLSWPMKHKITLSVINQASMETHRRREYSRDTPEVNKAAFDKPKDVKNDFICGYDKFMTATEVRDSPGVILNDSLVVSFNIK